MCFLLSLWIWETSKEGKDGKVGFGLIILHMPSDNCNNAHVTELRCVFTSNLSLAKINCHRNFGKVFAFTHNNEKLKRKCVEESLLTYFVT